MAGRGQGGGAAAGLSRPTLLAAAATLALIWAAVVKFVVDHAFSLYDDAYIYLRYVDNLRAGCGLRFNCAGDPVEGFTSPLYLSLLSLGSLLTDDMEALTQALGVLTLGAALSVTALTALQQRLLPGGALSGAAVLLGAALTLAADHFVLLNGVTGMETALGCLMVALVFHAALTRRPLLLGSCLVLAVLTRPEAALLVLALPLLPWTRSARFYLPLAGALFCLLLLRWLIFGDLLPNTYWAKAGGTARHLTLGLEYIADAAVNFPLLLLSPLALLLAPARRPVAYLLVVAAVWVAFFLRSGGDTFAYSRLLMPLVPTLTLLALAGLAATLGRVVSPRTAAAALLLLCAGAAGAARWRHQIPPVHGFPNVARWKKVGQHLAEHHAGRTIAAVPVGAIGYFSRLELIDLVGLNDRAIARAGTTVPPRLLDRRWIAHERHHTQYVLSRAPDLIVMTKWRPTPWTDLRQARAGFYAEWLLLRAIKQGRGAPYRLHSAEVAPGMHWLMFSRVR